MDLEKEDQRIDNYLNKTLSPEERLAFEEELKTKPAFKEDVVIHAIANEAINILLEEEIKSKLDAIRNKGKNKNTLKSRATIYKWIVAAVIIGLCLLIYFFIDNNQQSTPEPDVFEEQVLALERPVTSKNTLGSGVEYSWDECLAFYDKQLYQQAIECFNKIESNEPVVLQFVGHSYFRLKAYKEANQIFGQLLENKQVQGQQELYTKIEWNWLLTLVMLEDNRVDQYLDSLLTQPAYTYYQEAQTLKKISSQ